MTDKKSKGKSKCKGNNRFFACCPNDIDPLFHLKNEDLFFGPVVGDPGVLRMRNPED
jgi:hypothetical protein